MSFFSSPTVHHQPIASHTSLSLSYCPSLRPVHRSSSHSLLFLLHRQIDGLAPTFAKKPVIKQEDGGKHIKFECRVLADPKPTITWYRDGVKVQESARCKVSVH